MLEQCANCRREIGNLETPRIFNDYVVCRECHDRLSDVRVTFIPSVTRQPAPPPEPLAPEVAIEDPLAEIAAARSQRSPSYTNTKSRHRKKHTPMRLGLLLVGLIFPPVLLVWLVLGIVDMVRDSDT